GTTSRRCLCTAACFYGKDLSPLTAVILRGRSRKRAAVSKDGDRLSACGHPSRRARLRRSLLRVTAAFNGDSSMAKYAITGTEAPLSGSYKAVLSIAATTGALRRGKVFDLLIGTNGTPADNYLQWDISRMTAVGTATSVTPQALDPADTAALGTAANNYTA